MEVVSLIRNGYTIYFNHSNKHRTLWVMNIFVVVNKMLSSIHIYNQCQELLENLKKLTIIWTYLSTNSLDFPKACIVDIPWTEAWTWLNRGDLVVESNLFSCRILDVKSIFNKTKKHNNGTKAIRNHCDTYDMLMRAKIIINMFCRKISIFPGSLTSTEMQKNTHIKCNKQQNCTSYFILKDMFNVLITLSYCLVSCFC